MADKSARVLVLVKGLGLGGAERLVVESVRRPTASVDYEVAYVLPWKDQFVPLLESAGVPVTCIGGVGGSMFRAAAWLRRNRARWDLIHAHLPSTGILARLFGGRPVVYTEHNLAGSYRKPTMILNRLTYSRNMAVTAVSDAVRQSLDGYPGPRPITIRNGVYVEVDEAARDRVREHLGLNKSDPLVVHVGNIRPHKGHQDLVEACAMLQESAPEARVVSIGGEKRAGDLDRVRGLARSMGIENLRFLGRRTDAQTFVAAADLFVNPATVEGLPVAILEAMALGTAVVATAVGGVPSVVRGGMTGWLVPPSNPRALAAAMSEALHSHDERSKRALEAQRLVADEYSIDRMAAEFEDLYAHLRQ